MFSNKDSYFVMNAFYVYTVPLLLSRIARFTMLSQIHYDASDIYFFVHCFNCLRVKENV